MTFILDLGPNEVPLPTRNYVTPSKINPWRAARTEGEQFTSPQRMKMFALAIDPERVEHVRVRSKVSWREMWWPDGTPNPVYVFDCPIVERKGRKLKVITPAGMLGWVYVDGTISRVAEQ